MAKKKEEINDLSTKEFGSYEPPKISPVLTDFGRVDLNELRDKLNEVIKRV